VKKLFMSFSTLLRLIADGQVTQEELDTGFFMFGCTRGHALEPGAQGETDERTWNKGKNANGYPTLLAALLKAEEDGRAGWIRLETKVPRNPFAILNEMLVKHGITPLEHQDGEGSHYSYPMLAERIAAAGLPLQPVY
jgi:hypothetical protein